VTLYSIYNRALTFPEFLSGAMQLAGLGASWKLATYKNPRSPMHLDASELATSILDALPNLSDGVCLVSCTPLLRRFRRLQVYAHNLRG
jgi:hypothetical protein